MACSLRPSLPAFLIAMPVALAGIGCGEPLERLTVVAGPAGPVATTTCDAVITGVTPQGTLPAARTAPVVIAFAGHALPDEIKVRISGPNGEVPASRLLTAGAIEVRPDAPLVPGAHLVEANVCGSRVVRSFEVGAVHHPLAADAWASFAGRQLGLDLRYGTWVEPAPRAGRELILRNLFAGALVLDVVTASQDSLVAAVLPGVLAADGTIGAVAPTMASPLRVENPYALATFERLDLDVGGRALTLHDGAVVLGFTEDSVTDARLSAEVDVRDFGALDGDAVCDVLALHTFGGCVPCASDGEPSCFALTLEGLASHR